MASGVFHVVDYIIFVLTLVISLVIGLSFAYLGRNEQSTDEYLMGGRKMKLVPVAISMCVSFISTNTFLGAPAEMYTYGVHYALSIFILPVSLLLVVGLFVPLIYPLRLTSINKYLFLRYRSRAVQWTGAVQSFTKQAIYVGIVTYGPATALESVTGLPVWGSIIIVSLTGTLYTALGGMKAVIWTDVFQSVIMVSGLVAVIVQGSIRTGGVAKVWDYNMAYRRLHVNMSFDPYARYTLWTLLIGLTPMPILMFAVNQPAVQRYGSMGSMRRAMLCVALSIPGLPVFTTLATAAGMVAFAYYTHIGCDPLKAGLLDNANQVMPYFVTDILGYPGLPGLFVASLFSASLSTLSSATNSMAAIVWQDLLEDHLNQLTQARLTLINKIMVAVFGMGCMCFSFAVWTIGGNVLQLSFTISGVISGSYIGIFLLGMIFPWANWKGALVGAASSFAILCWMGFGQISHKTQRQHLPSTVEKCLIDPVNGTTAAYWGISEVNTMTASATTFSEDISELPGWLQKMYSVSFVLYTILGALICVGVGLIVSLITSRGRIEDVEARLVFPGMRRFCDQSGMTKTSLQQDNARNDEKKGLELSVNVTAV